MFKISTHKLYPSNALLRGAKSHARQRVISRRVISQREISRPAIRCLALMCLFISFGMWGCGSDQQQDHQNEQPDAATPDTGSDEQPDATAQDTGASSDGQNDMPDGAGADADALGDGANLEDAANDDAGREDAGDPDAETPEPSTRLIGEFDPDFADGQVAEFPGEFPDNSLNTGVFIGPGSLRADPSALLLNADDGVIVAGRGRVQDAQGIDSPKLFALGLSEDGSLSQTFGDDGVATHPLAGPEREIVVLAGAMQPDGKSLICGNVRAEEMGRAQLFVTRLNPDGALDRTFGNDPQMPGRAYFDVPEGAGNSLCWALSVLPDEKILVGGQLAANNTMQPLLMRLEPDGSLDTSFGAQNEVPGTIFFDISPENPYFYAKIRALSVLEDQKILALIDTADIGTGKQRGYLARFHPDGRLDEGFGDGAEYAGVQGLELPRSRNHEVFDFAHDSASGRIFIAGWVRPVATMARTNFFVQAVDAHGQVDTDFADAGNFVLEDFYAAARAIVLQPDGKILAVGSTITHPETAFEAGGLLVARLMPDGSLDTDFAPGAEVGGLFHWENPASRIYAARAQLDSRGRLLITGSAPETPDESPRGYSFVARLR